MSSSSIITSSSPSSSSSSLSTKYTIVRRKDRKPLSSDHAISIPNPDLNVPLCGFGNLKGDIIVGDIVGVVLRSSNRERVRFDRRSQHTQIDEPGKGKLGSFTRIEEHFFRIKKILTKSKFLVEPVFLDENKIILKQIQESFQTFEKVAVSKLSKYRLLECVLINHTIPLPTNEQSKPSIIVDDKWDTVSHYRIEKWIEKLQESIQKVDTNVTADASTLDESARTAIAKSLQKVLPFKKVQYTIIDTENAKELEDLESFYQSLVDYKDLIINYLGEEQLAHFGTLNYLKENSHSLYEQIVSLLPVKVADCVDNSFNLDCQLSLPNIIHDITVLKLSQIFRVYRPDPHYFMQRCESVTNWCGMIIPEDVRYQLQPGNIVRLYVGEKLSEEEFAEKKWQWKSVIYFQLVAAIPPSTTSDPVIQSSLSNDECIAEDIANKPTKFLASLINMYLSEYEDIVTVLDVHAISEIPVSWQENINLQIPRYLDPPERVGYSMTGLGATKETDETINFQNHLPFLA